MSRCSTLGVCAVASFFAWHPSLSLSAEQESSAQAEKDTVAEASVAQQAMNSADDAPAATGGALSTRDVILEVEGSWTILASTKVGHPTETRYCAAVASADIVNPGACGDPVPAALSYVFTLTLGNLHPVDGGGAERFVEFNNSDCPFGADAREKEVSTTRFFAVPPGRYRIYWLGRATGASSAAVDDASVSVVCTKERLPAD